MHLDVHFWRPAWVESDEASFRARLGSALACGRWICDGNFPDVADLHFAAADLIVWIDPPRRTCLRRALFRWLLERGRARPDMAEGCDEAFDPAFLAYIWRWNQATRPRIEAALARFASSAAIVRLRSDREVEAWLKTVRPAPSPPTSAPYSNG